MATGGDPPYEVFRKHSANLLTAIQDPEVLAWELYAENIISLTSRDAANNMMHGRGARTSHLLAAVELQIAVNPKAFDVFLSVLAKQPSMSDLCERIKDACGKSRRQFTSLYTICILTSKLLRRVKELRCKLHFKIRNA